MEKYFDTGFMFAGLGFFIFIIVMVMRSEDRDYQRRLSEAREFGFEGSKLQKEAQNLSKK